MMIAFIITTIDPLHSDSIINNFLICLNKFYSVPSTKSLILGSTQKKSNGKNYVLGTRGVGHWVSEDHKDKHVVTKSVFINHIEPFQDPQNMFYTLSGIFIYISIKTALNMAING